MNLEAIRNQLMEDAEKIQDVDQRACYIDGVLDMYNKAVEVMLGDKDATFRKG